MRGLNVPEETVLKAYDLILKGELRQIEIAETLGISQVTVSQIKSGTVHKDLYNELTIEQKNNLKKKRNRSLTFEQEANVKKLIKDPKLTDSAIADKLGISRCLVYNIRTGISYKDEFTTLKTKTNG